MKLEKIKINEIEMDELNPNEMDEDTFNHLVSEIKQAGMIDPPIVREKDGKYLMIDGEHRTHASKEAGLDQIPVVNLGKVSQEEARKLLINLNRIKGEFNPVKFANLLDNLEKNDPKQLLKRLNMSEKERNSYKLMREIQDLPELPEREIKNPKKVELKGTISKGNITGTLDVTLYKETKDMEVKIDDKNITNKVKSIKVDSDKSNKFTTVTMESE